MISYYEKRAVQEPLVPGMINGAIRALKCIHGAVPLLHASQGCQESLYFDGCFSPVKPRFCLQEMTEEPYLPSTIVNEEDVIFGAEERLETALELLYSRCRPELIAVLTTDAPEIIGDNVDDVLQTVEQEVDCQLIAVGAGSLNGDHLDGFRATLETLVNLMTPQETTPMSVNFVGITDEVSSPFDASDLEALLAPLGIHTNAILLSDTTLEEIKRAPAAALNVVLNEEIGLSTAKMMERQFGIPYLVGGLPYGIEGTSQWLLEVASFFGVEEEASNVVRTQAEHAVHLIRRYGRDLTFTLEVGVSADPTMAVGFSSLLQELGYSVMLLTVRSPPGEVMHSRLHELDRDDLTILVAPDYFDFKDVLKESDELDLIIGSFVDTLAAAEYGINVVELFYPLMRIVEWRGPVMGFGGAVTMAKKLAKYCIKQWL